MKCDRKDLLLYAVTDRGWVGKSTLYEQVESALKGGVTCVQLREKTLEKAAFLEEAFALKKLCRSYGVPFIINDDVEIAVLCGADGIHVGQSDMEAADVRSQVGDGMLLGVSVQTTDQAVAAERAGADYLGVGSVFHTSTKADADNLSPQTLKMICSAVNIPVVAIGGINKKNILELSGTGADGAALVSAIFAAGDIESECRLLKELARRMVSNNR